MMQSPYRPDYMESVGVVGTSLTDKLFFKSLCEYPISICCDKLSVALACTGCIQGSHVMHVEYMCIFRIVYRPRLQQVDK